jgi:FkbM family methyltransferase
MPRQPLDFPLRHPHELARSEALERQLEELRLNLKDPALERRGLKRLIRAGLRRTFRLLPTSLRNYIESVRHGCQEPDASYRFLKYCSSIVHVGANVGQERELYQRHGLAVVWIEPIPAVYEQLVRNIQPYPKQTAIQALLTDRGGDIVQLNISNNSGLSSSIFDLALHKDVWPEVDFVDHVKLTSDTLDGLMERGAVPPVIDAVVLDTQGSELLVLKGAQAVLRQASYVIVEAADFESYKGCATVRTIRDFLEAFSFSLVKKQQFARHPSGAGYYDLCFKKVGRIAGGDFRASKCSL